MNSCLMLFVFSGCIASSFAVKCFVCSSLTVDKDAKESYFDKPAYHIRTCQSPSDGDNCTASDSVDQSLTIRQFYKGPACSSFDSEKLNKTKDNIVECKVGCVKIFSAVTDRGSDASRTIRQCAFYDKDVVGKYINTPGFKRTGAGSDKVANWFYYCNSDYCNAASGLSRFSAVMIASFYGALAFLYH